MIYSTNNEPLVLIEADADSFLESVGVELFDDEIAINGTLYEGAYGEEILAENGIFLYEDGIVLEGKQAFAYSHAKKRAALDAEEKDFNRYTRRYIDNTPGRNTKRGKKSYNDRFLDRRNKYLSEEEVRRKKYFNAEDRLRSLNKSGHDKNSALYKKSEKVFNKAAERLEDFSNNTHVISDAIDRHIRRHPKQYAKKSTNESTIFSDIEII